MQWSQLKKRIEETFADSVKGRLEVWSTRYRHAVHQYGESWITIDKKKIATMGTLRFEVAFWKTARRLREERQCTDYRDPTQSTEYYAAHDEAQQLLREEGIFASCDLNRSLFAYLNLSIDDALASEDPIIAAFGMLDKRCGKRRLIDLELTDKHPLVSQFYQFRCYAEGLQLGQPAPHSVPPSASVAIASCQTGRD